MESTNSISRRLVRLIYASEKSAECKLTSLQEILAIARPHNRSVGISGFLCFGADRFLQCIEGPPAEVNTLYNKILKDPRHQRVQLLDYRDISVREFARWDMGYAFSLDPRAEVLGEQFGANQFLPHELTGIEAFELLRLLADAAKPHAEVTHPHRASFDETPTNSA